jgi:hypothetical protein
MAFSINSAYTLPEVLRSRAPNGQHMAAVDVLSGSYPFIEEMYFTEANDTTSHEFLRTSSEPTGTLVRLNEGAPFSSATTVPVKEQMARLEANAQIDERILVKAPDPVRYRREREAMHFRGLIKKYHDVIFNGDSGEDTKTINGLYTRYNEVETDVVASNGSATGATNSSIWLIKHGPEGFFGFYPKGSSAGIKEEDWGRETAYDDNDYPYKVLRTHWSWEFGIGVADPRSVKRLCNIAASGNHSFFEDGTTVQKGERNLIDLIEALPEGNIDNAVLYCGPKMMAQFRKRLNDKSNLFFTVETVWGRQMLHFMGIPIVRVDTLAATESVVS